jgi:uridine kinase
MTLAADLAAVVEGIGRRGRTLVAVDGPDAAGKTTLADRIAPLAGRPVVRASIDGFHAPRNVRLRRGDLSPAGCYRDSFDLRRLQERLLAPFARGAADVDVAVFDHRTDRPRQVRVDDVPPDAVLLVDGVFLLRPELRRWWTLGVYLHVPEEVTLARAVERDLPVLGSVAAVEERYRRRYLPAQALYRAEARPTDVAHVVVDTSDPAAPAVLRWSLPPSPAR